MYAQLPRPAVAALAIVGLLAASPAPPAYPPTATAPVTDVYFGHAVADPYRWLENSKDPAAQAWADAQSALALAYIQNQPAFAAYRQRIADLSRTPASRYGLVIRGGRLFYLRETPPQPQPELIVREGLSGAERVLFDPVAAANGGVAPSLEDYFVTPDGAKVAIATQRAGSEDETLRVIDVASGKLLADTLPHAGGGTSGVALAWDGDGKGFLHTLWPKNVDGTYATSGMLIYHHVLGTDPSSDTYVFGRGLSPRAEYALVSSVDGTVQALIETDGDGVHASVYLRGNGGEFVRVATPDAAIGNSADVGGAFVGDAFYAISRKRDPRGEVVALLPAQSFAHAKTVVGASAAAIERIVPLRSAFVSDDSDGGESTARLFSAGGTLRAQIPVPTLSTTDDIATDPQGGPVIFGYQSYVTPRAWFTYGPTENSLVPTGVASGSVGDYSGIVAERVLVPSQDGKVKIPLDIVHAKNVKMDGTAPTILTAYGAYGIISWPYFSSAKLAWLERGGVFAVAHVRGGGEYGDAWHAAARLATKTISSDDLASSARWLGAHGYGNAKHLGITGGSAGGFLMGLALTRNPKLYRAVVSEVGIYDLLRVELTPNGAYNTPEFGTVKDPRQFPWMLRQSPYHNVVRGRAYPAVLMTTGENDPRVDPYNSRKMIALLQADSSSPYPVLLIQRSGQGHGIGNSFDQEVESTTDFYAFFDSQLR